MSLYEACYTKHQGIRVTFSNLELCASTLSKLTYLLLCLYARFYAKKMSSNLDGLLLATHEISPSRLLYAFHTLTPYIYAKLSYDFYRRLCNSTPLIHAFLPRLWFTPFMPRLSAPNI